MKDFASEINLIVLIPLALQLLGLVLVVLLDPYIGKKQRRLLLLNAALIASLVALNLSTSPSLLSYSSSAFCAL